MNLGDILSTFGKDKAIQWVIDLPNFYIRPTRYFRNLFAKPIEEKISIASFYTSISILLLYIFTGDPIRELTKSILLEIVLLVFAFIILSINAFILDKVFRTVTEKSNIFLFLWLTKILSLPLQLSFHIVFHKTEMYEFLLIHNFILALLVIFVVFFSNKILYTRMPQIICGILLNFFTYNLFILSTHALRFDNHFFNFQISIMQDRIYNEYESKLLKMDSLTSRIPIDKYLITFGPKKFITYSFEKDSIQSVIDKMPGIVNKSFKFEIDILKSLKENQLKPDSFEFSRNRKLYIKLTRYLNTVKKDIENPLDTAYTFLVKREPLYIKEEKRYFGEIKQLTVNNALLREYIDYSKEQSAFIRSANISDYPLNIFYIVFFPAIKIVDVNDLGPKIDTLAR